MNPAVTPPITYSSAMQQYVYSQPFLLTGTYTLAVACGADDPGTADTLAFVPPAAVTVMANQTTTVNCAIALSPATRESWSDQLRTRTRYSTMTALGAEGIPLTTTSNRLAPCS